MSHARGPGAVAIQLPLADASSRSLGAWVQRQAWPDDAWPTEPAGYHVTVLYTPFEQRSAGPYLGLAQTAPGSASGRCDGVAMMGDPTLGTVPVAVGLHAPALERAMERLAREATALGLPVVRFPDGWRPHVTVATSSRPVALPPPPLEIATRGVVLRTDTGDWLPVVTRPG